MLPPIEQISYDEGSGGYHSPCSAAARFTSALNAPGSTTATRAAVSISTDRIRSRLRTTHPSTAVEPPDRPLPAPRGTTGTRCSAAQRTATCTSVALVARTTARGRPAETSRDQSHRYGSTTSGSVTTAPLGSAAWRRSRGTPAPFSSTMTSWSVLLGRLLAVGPRPRGPGQLLRRTDDHEAVAPRELGHGGGGITGHPFVPPAPGDP